MKFSDVSKVVANIPHMTKSQGELIYKLILDNKIENIVELGVAHGVGSCYMAAALHEGGKGSLTAIDNRKAIDRDPNVTELAKRCGLSDYVNPIFAHTSYNWELMKLIEQQTKDGVCEPIFDMCYLDGAHTFEVDGFAFFLVDKLMKPGGFILFDDLNWTHLSSPSLRNTDWVKGMADDEKSTAQVKKLIDLLVVQQPGYTDFSFIDDWFLARKKSDAAAPNAQVVTLDLYKKDSSVVDDAKQLAKKAVRRLLGR